MIRVSRARMFATFAVPFPIVEDQSARTAEEEPSSFGKSSVEVEFQTAQAIVQFDVLGRLRILDQAVRIERDTDHCWCLPRSCRTASLISRSM